MNFDLTIAAELARATTELAKATVTSEDTLYSSYNISILQEPRDARSCGVNSLLSKRVLDPCLVVEVVFPSSTPTPVQTRNLICIVSICEHDKLDSIAICKSTKTLYARDGTFRIRSGDLLCGQTTQSSRYLATKTGDMKHMFVFPDLAIRLPGWYRFKATVVNLKRYTCIIVHSSYQNILIFLSSFTTNHT